MAKKARGYTVNGVRKALAVNVGGVMKIAAHDDCCCEENVLCTNCGFGVDTQFTVTGSGFSESSLNGTFSPLIWRDVPFNYYYYLDEIRLFTLWCGLYLPGYWWAQAYDVSSTNHSSNNQYPDTTCSPIIINTTGDAGNGTLIFTLI